MASQFGPLNSHPVNRPDPATTAAQRAAHSRFLEGSMNDRTSAAPPLSFLGLETDEDYTRQFQLNYNYTAPSQPVSQPTSYERSRPRPASSAGASQAGKKGFFGMAWDGVREKFSFARAGGKAEEEKRPVSLDGKIGTGPAGAGAGAGIGGPEGMPTREEIMANYHQLLQDGFFDSHAIHSTRQPPPTGSSAHTYFTAQAGRPSTSTDRPQWPMAPPPQQHSVPQTNTSTNTDSQRGIKRNHEEGEGETQKTIKRLRKSASRIGADLTLRRPATRSSQTDKPPRNGILGRRSVSAASNKLSKRPVAKTAISGPMHLSQPPSPTMSNGTGFTRSSTDSEDRRMNSNDSLGSGVMRWARTKKSAEPLRVRPDMNQGIPSVPVIPSQYKHRGYGGEDVENAMRPPTRWRGLRHT